HRRDRVPHGRARSPGRDRRLLPPRSPERGGRELSPRAGLREGREPRRGPRFLGSDHRPDDDAILMPDDSGTFVRVERRGAAAWGTLAPPPLNLLVPEMIGGIKAAFDALSRDVVVRAAVLTGAGRATTAGMQLQFLQDLSTREAKAFIGTLHDAIHAV